MAGVIDAQAGLGSTTVRTAENSLISGGQNRARCCRFQEIHDVERPGDVGRGPPRRPRLARSGGLDRCSKLMDSLPCYRLVRMVPRVPC